MDKEYVYRDEHGRYCVSGPRMFLDGIVESFNEGESAESIRSDFPFLTLEEVYGAITFYLAHKQEVDKYLINQEEQAERLRAQIEAIPSPVVERLLQLKKSTSASQS